MTTRMTLFAAILCMMPVGCSQSPPPADSGKNEPRPVNPTEQGKLDAFVMPQKPAAAISVRDAQTRKEGEKVVVTGRVPPEKVKPYNSAVAAFVMLAPEDMDREEVKDEFECDDAATCPSCKQLLEKYGVQVELVDRTGTPVSASLEGFQGLKPGSIITVEGEVKRFGKDKKQVRILATKFFPG